LTGTANMKVLIADDTLYHRNRSKYVELLSRVFDHTDHRYYRGVECHDIVNAFLCHDIVYRPSKSIIAL
jgi:hypothetical protein